MDGRSSASGRGSRRLGTATFRPWATFTLSCDGRTAHASAPLQRSVVDVFHLPSVRSTVTSASEHFAMSRCPCSPESCLPLALGDLFEEPELFVDAMNQLFAALVVSSVSNCAATRSSSRGREPARGWSCLRPPPQVERHGSCLRYRLRADRRLRRHERVRVAATRRRR